MNNLSRVRNAYLNLRSRLTRAGEPFAISWAFYRDMPRRCAISDEKLVHAAIHAASDVGRCNVFSLDRNLPDWFYQEPNVSPLSYEVNTLKGNRTVCDIAHLAASKRSDLRYAHMLPGLRELFRQRMYDWWGLHLPKPKPGSEDLFDRLYSDPLNVTLVKLAATFDPGWYQRDVTITPPKPVDRLGDATDIRGTAQNLGGQEEYEALVKNIKRLRIRESRGVLDALGRGELNRAIARRKEMMKAKRTTEAA